MKHAHLHILPPPCLELPYSVYYRWAVSPYTLYVEIPISNVMNGMGRWVFGGIYITRGSCCEYIFVFKGKAPQSPLLSVVT